MRIPVARNGITHYTLRLDDYGIIATVIESSSGAGLLSVRKLAGQDERSVAVVTVA